MRVVNLGLIYYELKRRCPNDGVWHFKGEVCPLCGDRAEPKKESKRVERKTLFTGRRS